MTALLGGSARAMPGWLKVVCTSGESDAQGRRSARNDHHWHGAIPSRRLRHLFENRPKCGGWASRSEHHCPFQHRCQAWSSLQKQRAEAIRSCSMALSCPGDWPAFSMLSGAEQAYHPRMTSDGYFECYRRGRGEKIRHSSCCFLRPLQHSRVASRIQSTSSYQHCGCCESKKSARLEHHHPRRGTVSSSLVPCSVFHRREP